MAEKSKTWIFSVQGKRFFWQKYPKSRLHQKHPVCMISSFTLLSNTKNSIHKNPSLGFSLSREIPILGSSNQVLSSLCQDLATGKSPYQAGQAVRNRYRFQLSFIVTQCTNFILSQKRYFCSNFAVCLLIFLASTLYALSLLQFRWC